MLHFEMFFILISKLTHNLINFVAIIEVINLCESGSNTTPVLYFVRCNKILNDIEGFHGSGLYYKDFRVLMAS